MFYKWHQRYDQHGLDGLGDRSRGPRVCPTRPAPRSSARSSTCARPTTSGRPRSRCTSSATTTSRSATQGCGGSPKRLELNRLPASQRYKRHDRRWKRYEQAAAGPPGTAGREVHRAAGWLTPQARPVHRYRRLHPPAGPAHRSPAQPEDGHPVCRLPTGAPPVPGRGHRRPTTAPSSLSLFHYHVLDKGIGHDDIKPRTPRLNGKVERSHRIDAEEFYQLLDGVVIDDTEVFNDKLREWENFYNYHRPHGGLGGQTPYERLKQRTQTRV